MATWAWRTASDEHEGLTLYQLQEHVRTGRAAGEDLVRLDDGPWLPLADEPRLARLLPASTPPPARTQVVAGITLALDEDGKPVPPSAEEIAKLLSASTTGGLHASAPLVRKLAFGLAALLAVVALVLVVALVAGF